MPRLGESLTVVLLLFVAVVPRTEAQDLSEQNRHLSDAELCPRIEVPRLTGPSPSRADKQLYKQDRRDAAARRDACLQRVERWRDEPRKAARDAPRFGISLGYDGSLWVPANSDGRYRAPSAQLGGVFRQHYARRIGLHVSTGLDLGRGVVGAANDYRIVSGTKKLGPRFGLVSEVGLLFGAPFYFSLAAQLRMAFPRTTRTELHSSHEDETVVVRLDDVLVGLGARGGLGWMFGDLHQYWAELSMGGGGQLGHVGGGYFTFAVCAGLLLGG